MPKWICVCGMENAEWQTACTKCYEPKVRGDEAINYAWQAQRAEEGQEVEVRQDDIQLPVVSSS